MDRSISLNLLQYWAQALGLGPQEKLPNSYITNSHWASLMEISSSPVIHGYCRLVPFLPKWGDTFPSWSLHMSGL